MTTLLMLTLMTTDPPAAASDDSATGTQSVERFDGTTSAAFDYLLSLPDGYASSEESVPLVVFLHGAGERGEDVSAVAKHGPPKLVRAGREFPFILVSPQCRPGRWWQPTEVLALIDHVQATHRVDADRIYLTGLSMGGFGAWETAGLEPDRFAAIAPVCGGGTPMIIRNLTGVPVWAFHGDADPVVPAKSSQRLVDAVNERGGNAKLTLYKGVGHDSWTQTYDDPQFWDWLLSQRRSPSRRSP